MKIFLLILLLLSALSDILCQNFSPDEDNWINNRYPNEVNVLESDLQTMLERVSRAPGLQQVFGLMGKRSSGKNIVKKKYFVEVIYLLFFPVLHYQLIYVTLDHKTSCKGIFVAIQYGSK
ncbi:Protachykinin-1 [Labeo rohita]|uniref:Protachykinin-1 n=1 Tax=Labeo rohita TaxID=84645 RepID=A0ABQ8LW84_LABRO|nr:Protachykinin-1 [Labeo rohita]